jgi:hypothetical protein
MANTCLTIHSVNNLCGVCLFQRAFENGQNIFALIYDIDIWHQKGVVAFQILQGMSLSDAIIATQGCST